MCVCTTVRGPSERIKKTHRNDGEAEEEEEKKNGKKRCGMNAERGKERKESGPVAELRPTPL